MMGLSILRNNKVAYAVLRELVKGYKLGLGVSARAVSRIYGVRPASVYEYLETLKASSLVVKVGKEYKLVSNVVAETFTTILKAEATTLKLGDAERILYLVLPDTRYYIASISPKAFTTRPPTILFIDKNAWRTLSKQNKTVLRKCFDVIITKTLHGRIYSFSWDIMLSVAEDHQAYADILSFHPSPEACIYDLVYSIETGDNYPDPRKVYDRCSSIRCRKLIMALATLFKIDPIPKINLSELTEEEKTAFYESVKALTKTPKLPHYP